MRNVCSGMKNGTKTPERGIHREKLTKEVRTWYFEEKRRKKSWEGFNI